MVVGYVGGSDGEIMPPREIGKTYFRSSFFFVFEYFYNISSLKSMHIHILFVHIYT